MLTGLFFLFCCSMRSRRLLLSLSLLPTITETLEDLPVHPSSVQPAQTSHSQEDYMTSIQALARPDEALSYGPVRGLLQRSSRLRQLSKAQTKLSGSVSAARMSPLTPRTSRSSCLNTNSTEELSLKMSRERDCRGKDPLDWLFGQIRTWRETLLLWEIIWVLRWSKETRLKEPREELQNHGCDIVTIYSIYFYILDLSLHFYDGFFFLFLKL